MRFRTSRTCWNLLLITLWLISAQAQTSSEYSRQAATLVEQLRYEEALILLNQALEKLGNDGDLLLQKGSLLVKLGRVVEGEAVLEDALRLQPHNSHILNQRAEARLRQGRLSEATQLFRRALKHSSQDGESHYRLAYTLFLQGADQEALEQARQAVQANALEPRYRRFFSLLLDLAGEADSSDRELLAAYRLDPGHPDTAHALSNRYWRRGQLQSAIHYAERAVQLDGENPRFLSSLARFYRSAGRAEAAQETEHKSKAMERAFEDHIRAVRLMRQERITEAILILESATRRTPHFVSGQLLLADLYQRRGNRDAALRTYLSILEHDPSRAVARRNGAWIGYQQGSLDLALKLLQDRDPQDLTSGMLVGYRLMLEGRWKDALTEFRLLERSHPLDADLLQMIGFCLAELGREREAFEELQKAEQLRPRDPHIGAQRDRIFLDQALRLQDQKAWKRSADLLRGLIAGGRDEPHYHFYLAYALQHQGRLRDAVEHYRKGLKSSPDENWARINLASSLYLQLEYEQAAREWERVLARQVTAETLFQVGLCYAHLGRDLDAERAFERALDLEEPSAALLYNLGITRLRLLKTDEAWPLIRQSASLGYHPAGKLLAQSRER